MKKKEKIIIKTSSDVLKILCEAIKDTLSKVTNSKVTYSSTFIKTNKTCLRPDIGSFVLFEGGFTGLVAMNFSGDAALEIYRKYNISMGMPEDELATHHTSSEVADTIGELMNQCIGQFQISLKKQLGLGVTQNQPKMVALNQAMKISLETEIDKPLFMRVEFRTQENKLFYLETTFEKVDFLMEKKPDVIKEKDIDVDDIIESHKDNMEGGSKTEDNQVDEEFLKKLGL
jgi:CheY-specific phosphatase CheX